jgi:hypothetical protein
MIRWAFTGPGYDLSCFVDGLRHVRLREWFNCVLSVAMGTVCMQGVDVGAEPCWHVTTAH